MKSSILKMMATGIVLCAMSFQVQAVNGPVLPPVVDPNTDILTQIRTLVQTINDYLGLNLSSSTTLPTTPATPNLAQLQAIPSALNQNLQGKTLLFLNSAFNSSIDQQPNTSPPLSLNQRAIYNGLTTQNHSPVLSYMADLGISQQAATTSQSFPGGNTPTPAPNPNDDNLNFETLIGPLVFPNNSNGNAQEVQAMNFIRFSSGQANPLEVPDFSTMKDTTIDQKNSFIVGLREYLALRSVATSNLYQILSQRHLVQGLGQRAGMIDGQGQPINDASPMQVEDYLIAQRLLNPQWYQGMEKAAPITLQRETLYVLAEMQRTMNEMQKTNERILATLSAIELSGIQSMKTGLLLNKNTNVPPPNLPQPTSSAPPSV